MAVARSNAWVFPVVILAVPGVMFYVWWSQLNAEQRKQMTMKIRKRTPEVFTASPAGSPLVNPIAQQGSSAAPAASTASTAAAPAPAPGADPAAAQPQPLAQPEPAAGAQAQPAPDPMQAAAQPPQPAPLAEAQPPGQAQPQPPPPLSAPPVNAPTFTRDPTLSPFDLVRIEQQRLEQELRERELAEAQRRMTVRRNPPVESLIDLQGVISTPESGNKAIINGEIVGEGELVAGAKVVRITTQGVVFLHKGRKFSKTISK